MTAKFISLLKPNKENAYSIGRTVLESIKITDDRSIIDTLLALSWVARSLKETLNAVRKDLGDNFENQIFMDDNWYLNNVWHPASEKPSGSGKILYLGETGVHLTTYPPHFDWNDSVEKLIIQKWAWTEDLLPD